MRDSLRLTGEGKSRWRLGQTCSSQHFDRSEFGLVTLLSPDLQEVRAEHDAPRKVAGSQLPSDRVFNSVLRGAGVAVLLVMALVGIFLSGRAFEALRVAKWRFFTTADWKPGTNHFGVPSIVLGTVLIALVAITLAVPLALGTALYISEYAPRRLRGLLVSLVDLMAAVPSVVYGLWGFYLLQPTLLVHGQTGEGLPRWLATYLGWIPIFTVDNFDTHNPATSASVFLSSTLIAGIVVSLMVSPIMCSIMREVFSQAPVGEREGAYALGATRWGVVRSVVLPFAKGGIIGGSMLGLGRALGETIAVLMIISPVYSYQPHILQKGAISVSSLIALRYNESTGLALSALMAAGLTLFVITLVVNMFASSIVSRSRSGAVTG